METPGAVLAIVAIVSYLLGTIPFGLLLTKFAGLGDIRDMGSGNVGATNVLRTGRKGIAAATLIFDAAKGAAPVLALAFWQFGHADLGLLAGLAAVLSRVLREERLDRVVDLGSGAGGVMPEVLDRIRQQAGLADVKLLLSDLYPNRDTVEAIRAQGRPELSYRAESLSALDLEGAPGGLKTMVNCFHHMRPAQARAILESAQRHRQPLLVYEIAEPPVPFALWCLGLPLNLAFVALLALLLPPFVRPLCFRQLFFTYVIPLVPLFYAWDGAASVPRVYSRDDLGELLDAIRCDEYAWETGRAEKGEGTGFYLLGRPVQRRPQTKTPTANGRSSP